MAAKSSFVERVLDRLRRMDTEGLQTVVHRLARERSFMETLLNAIEDGVLVADENGRIIYFNEAVTRLLYWDPETAEGRPVAEVLPELPWPNLTVAGPNGEQRATHHEIEIAYPRPRFLRVYAAPLHAKARSGAGIALILHDATEARQQTFEAIESGRIHALTLLAASVAHEIGNPLNALNIHLQLLSKEVRKLRHPTVDASARRFSRGAPKAGAEVMEIAQKLERYLDVAKGEITRLDYIVNQFLQAMRPSLPQLAAGSLNDVARETLELLRPELENRGLRVKEKLAQSMPLAPLDAGQMKQVLLNLIKNAMQAMTTGGVLTVQTSSGGDWVWVDVGDTGGGIPPDKINHIFEPFYTTKKKGTGLGLMNVQRIVNQHQGKIEVESRVGQGTTFRIRLPAHEKQPKLLQATQGESQSNEHGNEIQTDAPDRR
ncbi:MAG TPA: ATP-binding protein [Verrucomicrobiae bacterium]